MSASEPKRRPWWVRVLGVLLSLVVTVIVFLWLALEGTTSASGGWLPAAAALLPGFLLGAFALGWGRWYVLVGSSVGLALLAGSWLYQTSPPEHERIEAVAVQVGAPQGWDLVTREAHGNTWCPWNDCPEMHYDYATTSSDTQARDDFTILLEADGWDRDDLEATWRDDPENYQEWHKGRWHVLLNIQPVGAEGRAYDTTIPQDLTKVSLLYRG